MTGGTDMISKMTLKDKIALCEGKNFGKPRSFPSMVFHPCLCVMDPWTA